MCQRVRVGFPFESSYFFLNFALSGVVLESVRPFFFGAKLVALKKKDGGIRPIAVRNTLCRLGVKCAGIIVRDGMAELWPRSSWVVVSREVLKQQFMEHAFS